MKTTPFTDIHIGLGAKMHEFAGYNMPIEYSTGINDEHLTVVNGVGVFDVSHMGEFWVKALKLNNSSNVYALTTSLLSSMVKLNTTASLMAKAVSLTTSSFTTTLTKNICSL